MTTNKKEEQQPGVIEEVATKAAAKKATQSVKKQFEPVVYIGPTITGIVTTGTTFNNGLPKPLEMAIEECKPIKGLLIPVKELSKARVQIKEKGSAINTMYKKVVVYRNMKGEL